MNANSDQPTIAIMGQDIPAQHDSIDINQLLFLPDNPRVYAAIREMQDFDDLTTDEKQQRIYEHLLREPSVKNLIPEIQRDGGLQEPIVVRHDTRQVIEGNSRLAAYRKLHEGGDSQWASIRCIVVTSLTDDQQTRLLGQAHLHGKTEWSPYAKSLFCYRWVVEQKQDISTLADLSGFSALDIKKHVKIITLMQENNDNTHSNYSYYDVLVRNRAISSAIEGRETLRDTLLTHIKTEGFTAQQMRNCLPTVLAKPKILKKFESGDVTLEDAYDRAKISGAQRQLKKTRESLDDIELNDVKALEQHELKAVRQVIKRIGKSLKRVSDMVEAELSAKSTTP